MVVMMVLVFVVVIGWQLDIDCLIVSCRSLVCVMLGLGGVERT